MPCITFVRVADGVCPIFVRGGEVIDPNHMSWSPSATELNELTITQLSDLISKKALNEKKPKKKEEFVSILLESWTDTIQEKNQSLVLTGGQGDGGHQDDHPDRDASGGGRRDGGGDDPNDSSDEPEGDDDPETFSQDNGFLRVSVRSTFGNFITRQFIVKSNWKVSCLRPLVLNKFRVPPSIQRFVHQSGRNVHFHLTFSENGIGDGQQLLLSGNIGGGANFGGRKIQKHHVKQQDAVANLNKKSNKVIHETFYDDDDEAQAGGDRIPPPLSLLLQPILAKTTEVQNKLNDGVSIVKEALETLTDNELKMVKEIFTPRQHVITEEKLIKCVGLFIDEVKMLENYEKHVKRTKVELYCLFTKAYGIEFNKAKGSGVEYDNARFLSEISEVERYRARVRRSLEAPRENHEGQDVSDERRCVLM